MIIQEVLCALNYVISVGKQAREVSVLYEKISWEEFRQKTINLFKQVGFPSFVYYPSGCRFHPRFLYTTEKRRMNSPDLFRLSDSHSHRCWYSLIDQKLLIGNSETI